MVIGSSVVSSEWVRPLVDSVVLPVHAQTSGGSISGTFGSRVVTTFLQPQDDLLNMLVPTAKANDDFIGHSTCGINEGTAGIGHYDGSGAFAVLFNITGTTVDVCVASLGGSTVRTQQCTKSGVTSLNGSAIADLDIVMDADIDTPP